MGQAEPPSSCDSQQRVPRRLEVQPAVSVVRPLRRWGEAVGQCAYYGGAEARGAMLATRLLQPLL